jgi:hypothetical protein
MSYRLFLGGPPDGYAYRFGNGALDDGGTPLRPRAVTQVFVPASWWGEFLARTATIIVSSNAGLGIRVTPISEGVVYDGQDGRPDARVSFTVPTPSGSERVPYRAKVGLFRPTVVNGVAVGRSGIRGTWFQLLLETTSDPVLGGESPADVRFEGVDLDYRVSNNRQPTVGP